MRTVRRGYASGQSTLRVSVAHYWNIQVSMSRACACVSPGLWNFCDAKMHRHTRFEEEWKRRQSGNQQRAGRHLPCLYILG